MSGTPYMQTARPVGRAVLSPVALNTTRVYLVIPIIAKLNLG